MPERSHTAVRGPGAVVSALPEAPGRPRVLYRQAGDAHLLIEYGEMVLDLNLRFRVHALEGAIRAMSIDGVGELVPGVRSLLLEFDPLRLPQRRLLGILKALEPTLPPADEMEVPSRLVHLPIAYHDRWTREAVRRYQESVRATAPYLPDNVAFVARCNGLAREEEVAEYHAATAYLVLGLGDVYLGAPCAVALDPRFRLVAPKYNPARLWTPEGAVGIGGAYICIYPMESPGGYQLIGRTIAIWDAAQRTAPFAEAPWLLRFFDRIRFTPVTEEDLEAIRAQAAVGSYTLRIEPGTFSVREYNRFLAGIAGQAAEFRRRQREAAARAMVGY